MFCTKCGNALPDDARFCTVCGAAMAAPADAPAEAPAAAEPAAEPVATPEVSEPVSEPVAAPEVSEPVAEPVAAPEVTEAVAAPEVVAEAPEAVEVPTETAAPEALPNDEQAPVTEESANYAAPSCVPYTEDAPVAPAPKKGKKKLILLIVAAVLALALIVGGVIFAVAYNSPEAKLLRAAKGSGEQLELMLANSPEFLKLVENATALSGDRTITTKTISEAELSGLYSSRSEITYRVDQSLSTKQYRLQVESEILLEAADYPELNTDAHSIFEIYADEQELILSVPEEVEGAYSLPMDHLGEKLLDSELGDLLLEELEPDEETLRIIELLDIDLFFLHGSELKELCPDEYQRFMDGLTVEKSDTAIVNAENTDQVYRIGVDMNALVDLILAYEEYAIDAALGQGLFLELEDDLEEINEDISQLREYELVAYAGVRDGNLIAAQLQVNGEESHTATFILCGSGNIWEEFVLYADEELVLEGGLCSTEEGFRFSAEADGEVYTLECRDREREVEIPLSDMDPLTWNFSTENGGYEISYEMESEEFHTVYSMTAEPVGKIEKPEGARELFSMTVEELESLAEDLMGFFLGY